MYKIFFLLLLPLFSVSQKIYAEEEKLYQLILNYRKQSGLSAIPLSKSLTVVAQTHVKDLAVNRPDVGKCNMHSWSDKGKWTSCCYTDDHRYASCIWNKPAELTNYKESGYEICAWSSSNITPEQALQIWKESPGHNAMILNLKQWKNADWKAIGIGIYNGYAAVWFGEFPDPE